MSHSPSRLGKPYKADVEGVVCPACGVQQERTVMAQEYEEECTQYFIDEECPVCGFDDVWW